MCFPPEHFYLFKCKVLLGVVLVRSCMCKGSENIIKTVFMSKSQVLHISIYIKEEFMTYRYKTRIRLTLKIGDRAGHMYHKAHAQQQQQRRVSQTLRRTTIPLSPENSKTISKNISHNIIISIMA